MKTDRVMRRCAAAVVLLCMACGWSTAHAITIKVKKGGAAPYLHAWNDNGNLLGPFPGTQFTEKDADGFWTMDVTGSVVNIIFSMGSSGPQTGDINAMAGVDGVAKFYYNGATQWFSPMPEGMEADEGYIYFVCPPNWGDHTPHVHFINSSGGQLDTTTPWPGREMAYVGVDGAGCKIYKFYTGDWNGISKLVFNNNDNGSQTANLAYVENGYYNYTGDAATVHKLNVDNGYTDSGFRSGVATQLGIKDGDVFVPESVTTLNVSGKSISTLAGINKFTNLIELNASNNSLTCTKNDRSKLNLSSNANLETLILNGNSGITSVDVAALKNLKHLEMSACNINDDQTFAPAGNHTALTYLDMSDNPTEKGFPWHQYLPNLETLIVGNANIKPNGFTQGDNYFTGMNKLKYLDVSKCPLVTSIYLTGAPNLETLILNRNTQLQDADNTTHLKGINSLHLKRLEFTDVDLATATLISNLVNSKSTLEYLDLSRATMHAPSMSGFTALTTFKAAGNYNLTSGSNHISMTTLTINNSPLLSSIDVSGNTALETLNLTNIGRDNSNIDGLFTGLADCTALKMINLDGNNFTSVPAFGHDTYTSIKLNKNQLTSIDMTGADPGVRFLYAEQNNTFPANYELTAESAGPLHGLDLGNNGLTSFSAIGTNLSALMVGDNAAMTTLTLRSNPNLTKTTTVTTMSEGSGLYLLGNTNLVTLDLESTADAPGAFNSLGASGSLAGLTKVKTLKAAYNRLTTFSNATSLPASSYKNIEKNNTVVQVPAVAAHPDLPNLEALTALEWLDLSHNTLCDSVHLYKNTQLKHLDVSNNQVITHNPDKGKVNGSFISTSTIANEIARGNRDHKPYLWIAATQSNVEPYTGDQNDTIGVYHIDLKKNPLVEYININNTGIEYTALHHYYTYNTRYIWIQDCAALKEFYADNNGMRAFGVSHNPNIERISGRGMRGADRVTMQGSINLHGENCPNLHFADFRDSQFDSIGTCFTPALDTLLISGNPIQYLDFCRTGASGSNTLAPNYNLVYVDASDCTVDKRQSAVYPNGTPINEVGVDDATRAASGLLQVNANELPHLKVLKLTGDTELKNIYAHDDAVLPGFEGLETCSALQTLHAYNDPAIGQAGLNVDANSHLADLWVSNDNLTALSVAGNLELKKLRCYDNRSLPSLDVRANGSLELLDCHTCMLQDLDVSSNQALKYLDCSSDPELDELPVATDHPGWNTISDLNFASDVIEEVYANANDLHSITGLAGKTALKALQFKHNHINGIDLTGCTALTAAAIKDEDNGREITANYALVSRKEGDAVVNYDVYFFQVDAENTGGNKYLGNETSTDVLKSAVRPKLTEEGMAVNNVTGWTAGSSGTVTGRRQVNTPGTADVLVPDQVSGTVVVLTPASEGGNTGHSEYTYDNGISQSTFYLDWSATPGDISTQVEQPVVASDVTSTRYVNMAGVESDEPFGGVNIVVRTHADGTVTTTKEVH